MVGTTASGNYCAFRESASELVPASCYTYSNTTSILISYFSSDFDVNIMILLPSPLCLCCSDREILMVCINSLNLSLD